MTDVIVTVPVTSGEEDRLFGRYVDSFIERCAQELAKACEDAPFLMVRSDPSLGGAVKVVIFQEPNAANAFSQGWTQARRRWTQGAA